MKTRITYIVFILAIAGGMGGGLYAQNDKVAKAQELYGAKDFEGAKTMIDEAVRHPESQKDPFAWSVRSFVYYELYKKSGDKLKLNSALRDSSVHSAIVSGSLKADEKTEAGNKSLLKNFAGSYYNICKSLLQDSVNFDRSQLAYKKYKDLYVIVDPAFDFKQKDIEYFSAVGSQFSDRFNADNTKTQFGEVGKIALMKVLELDPKNISANINLGIIYYNQGVNLINQMDLDTPLDKLEVIQDNSAKLFKQSLPFMNKVYQLDPKNVKALESLRQIYQALNDPEKSIEFNKKLEEAKKGK
ncbi:MAG: tetratricopeptide repeat protein [Bacteroidia bacterium]